MGLCIALYVVSRYFLTERRMHEIRAELEARRGKV
jgi:GPH family glycoside/pentoside/hexuronide:cation symporter